MATQNRNNASRGMQNARPARPAGNGQQPPRQAPRPTDRGTAATGQALREQASAVRLTPEQIAERRRIQERKEAERRAAAAEKARIYREQREKKKKRQRLAFTLLVTVLVLAILGAGIWFLVRFLRSRAPERVRYEIGTKTYAVLRESVTEKGLLYVNFSDVAAYLALVPVGDTGSVRYLLPTGTGDSAGTGTESGVRLTADSRECVINGETVEIPTSVRVKDGSYWVPCDFVQAHMTGVSLTVTGRNRVSVQRITVKETDGSETPVPIGFTSDRLIPWPETEADTTGTEEGTATETKDLPGPATDPGTEPPPVTEPGTETDPPPVTEPPAPVTEPPAPVTEPIPPQPNDMGFRADLSSFEPYMDPQGSERDAYLILVNKVTTVGADFVPVDLVKIPTEYTYNGRTVEMRETAAKAMEAMFRELFAQGFKDMHITSGYRSYEYQVSLYNTYVKREMDNNKKLTREQAEKIVDTYSAKAGTSEHQTGLCADMHNLSSADKKFAKQKAYAWLKENAWKFGFILRFPEDGEEITGYSFEPWHWRFVGRYHAYRIWAAGQTLEEYLKTLE